ncbi:MAG: type III restriction-modification system endonuclease [Planctomycetaceae bacterium]
MKLQFKKQAYQQHAVDAVADVFLGQPRSAGIQYTIDPGRVSPADRQKRLDSLREDAGFKNADLALPPQRLLENLHAVQRRSNLPDSAKLIETAACQLNLDIEMETGTGKTYCYIKTMFELHQRYGWGKFIVVVPSIAIREGVKKSFEITAEHFLEEFGQRARVFIYNSKRLHEIESFSSDAGINVMIINIQAFQATGKDARRIYEELDDFQSRKPIDVIQANQPILILDEPQKMEGKKTVDALKLFRPLMILRYSATHKTEHNKVYRLDALDAYNQKLVKKVAVRGISVRGLAGTTAYLYLAAIQVSTSKPPVAKLEFEIKQAGGIKRVQRLCDKGTDLFAESHELAQYRGYVISDIDAIRNTVSFANGVELTVGEATGDVSEANLRRIQIREAIRAHLDKERRLFAQGIKVLSLFFIDEVAKYRQYDASGAVPGEYARLFEEEYAAQVADAGNLFDPQYNEYLRGIAASRTHDGYFSIDKKTNRLVDPEFKKTGETKGEADDVDAYDLILKNKERLLSFDEPVRFLFSHSALREGWDNPNVFVICTLKHSDNTISRRQEVGRGMRLAVNQRGERIDDPATVHQINVLTVVASESYREFVSGLQKDLHAALSDRPRAANEKYFTGKILRTPTGEVKVTPQLAKQIVRYLVQNDYTDVNDQITQTYVEAKREERRAALPEALAPHAEQVYRLIDAVFSDALLPDFVDDSKRRENPLSANFHKKEFQQLWSQINRKAAYTVHFDTAELIRKCIAALDRDLRVTMLQYTVHRGEQKETATYDEVREGTAFLLRETSTEVNKGSVESQVVYDLVGRLAQDCQLTRRTIAGILQGVNTATFSQYAANPEEFFTQAARLINEQKATVIVEHLTYDITEGRYDSDIFTREKPEDDFSRATPVARHVYEYVFTDSTNETNFVKELDSATEVAVYAKLPKSFFIPTPVGNYNPDWAIAFQEGTVKHVFFIAETKGSMSSMQLRLIEDCKIQCARKFFGKLTSERVKYDVVESYERLMQLVR